MVEGTFRLPQDSLYTHGRFMDGFVGENRIFWDRFAGEKYCQGIENIKKVEIGRSPEAACHAGGREFESRRPRWWKSR
jgi:hypothetical protein